MLTESGLHRVIDITSFLPGRTIPFDFCKAANAPDGGPWFFQPVWWSEENAWGRGSTLFGFPHQYSPGYPTPEAALLAADEWERLLKKRDDPIWRDLLYMNTFWSDGPPTP